jgi:hypothetical protein
MMLHASESAVPGPDGKIPTADSNISMRRIPAWSIAGSGSRRVGNGGMPIEMDERERNTVVW